MTAATIEAARGPLAAERGAGRPDVPRRVPKSHSTAPVPASETPGPIAPRPLLPPRALEVLDLVADGLTNRAIGRQLGISHLTVKSWLAHASGKLGTGRRTGMVGVAYRLGMFEPDPSVGAARLPDLPLHVWAVLPLVALGRSDEEIAADLGGVTENAAHRRLMLLMRAFGAASRTHLVRLAVDSGALTPRLALAERVTACGAVVESARLLPAMEARALAMVAVGMSDRAIADVLGVPERAAGDLVRAAAKRLRAVNRSHAVFVACGLGILGPAGQWGGGRA